MGSMMVGLPLVVANLLGFIAMGFWGWVGDVLGRRWSMIIPAAIGLFITPSYLLTSNPLWILLGLLVQGMFAGAMYSQMPSYITERFPTEERATASAVTYRQGAIFGGLVAPILTYFAVDHHFGFAMKAPNTSVALSESDHRRELRKAVIASTVGTTIEWYDFLLYSIVTPLVFGKMFFPYSAPLIGVLEAFSIYFVGFVGRSIGAFIFGHYGDRIGRKAALIVTLLITGLSTFAVGFVPGYASVGVWGAVILTVIRMIQGIGVGGEWGGSVLFAMEWARTNKHRGFITSWPQIGGPAGLFLANMAVLVGSTITGDSFFDWGWRIPFWLSIIMVAIGLYIRLGILETPVFQRIIKEERIESVPAIEVFRRQPKQVFLSMLCRSAEQDRPTSIWLLFSPIPAKYYTSRAISY